MGQREDGSTCPRKPGPGSGTIDPHCMRYIRTIFALHIHRMQYICAVDALRMQFVCASHMRTRQALCMHYSIYALHALHVTHTHSSYLHTAGSLDMYDTYPYALYAHYVQSTGTTVHRTCALCCRPNVSPQNSHVAPAPQGGGIRRWGLQ